MRTVISKTTTTTTNRPLDRKYKMECLNFYFLMSLDGSGVNLVVETVLRVIKPVVGVEPFETTAGLDVRREMDAIRLTDVVCCVVGVFTDPAMPPIVRLEMPDTARRTIANFDEAASGRSILFGLVTFNRDVSAGDTILLAGTLPVKLPRLARRFNVDSGGRAKIEQTHN